MSEQQIGLLSDGKIIPWSIYEFIRRLPINAAVYIFKIIFKIFFFQAFVFLKPDMANRLA